MNFFEQQDIAHRNTKRFIFLLCLAVISLVAITTLLFAVFIFYSQQSSHPYLRHMSLWQGIRHSMNIKIFLSITAGVVSVIVMGSLYKFYQLSAGGKAVAEALGGRLINLHNADFNEKKILNVVEEMAIASGTPVPPVYILEDEAMNAFAAGHTPQDAVIGVTRGLIRVLNRDELQGVVAHEFSHIFHGDMKINMRLIALLNGILLLGLIGEFLWRSSGYSYGFRTSRDKSPAAAMMGIGIGLMIIGYAGTFFGNLIKSAVSRQREFLADASAVKFTRNPDGIGGALKKLGGYVGGSQMDIGNASQFSHMFFGESSHGTSFLNALASHPPLEERIKRIDPNWDGEYPSIDVVEEDTYIEEARFAKAGYTSNYDGKPIEFSSPQTAVELIAGVDQVLQTIGRPNQSHLNYARQTLSDISEPIRKATHNPWEAQALMFGLLLDQNESARTAQWTLLSKVFKPHQIESIKPWAQQASILASHLRLPLVELSLPALKNLSPAQYQQFKYAINALIRADQHINLTEWSYYRILTHNLEPKLSSTRLLDLDQLEKEVTTLLSAMANAGASTDDAAEIAFNSGKSILGFTEAKRLPDSDYSMLELDVAVTRLNSIKPLQKPKLLKAMSQCVLADNEITVAEAELFRAIADALDCPVPPLVAGMK